MTKNSRLGAVWAVSSTSSGCGEHGGSRASDGSRSWCSKHAPYPTPSAQWPKGGATAMSELRDGRERIGAALRTGDYHQARQAVADLLEANTSGRVLRLIAGLSKRQGTVLAGVKPAKIAVLSSYSIEFLDDALTVACFLKGVVPELYQPAFNQFQQEILAPDSGLYRFAPDIVILS